MTQHQLSFARSALIVGLLCGVIVPASVVQAVQNSDWDQVTRSLVLARAEQALGNYFYANRVTLLRGSIEAHRSELLGIDDEKKFADALTNILQQAGQDKHIIVWFSEESDENQSRKPTSTELARQQRFFQYVAYGYNASARLPGNIGYIALGGFADMPAAKSTIDAAMELVRQTSSLIVDLRGNGGGDSDTVDYLLAYFFAKPMEVTGAVQRIQGKDVAVHDFTPATVAAPRYVGKPVYVLIDHGTISGGEMFAYDIKSLRRGLVIGQVSAGAASGLGSRPYFLSEHLSISVPDAVTRNPYTGTNWEGVGVIPDVKIDGKDALTAAYARALASVDTSYDPLGEIAQAQKDPEAALKAFFPRDPQAPLP
ncbi:MAG: S41 family peptidase [Candidatus Cybelea sp.]